MSEWTPEDAARLHRLALTNGRSTRLFVTASPQSTGRQTMSEQTCPTCGCRVVATDEGTHYPVEREELWQILLATGADPDGADARHLNPGEALRAVEELRREADAA